MESTTKNNLKIGSKISLVILLFFIIAQFVAIYQTTCQLENPLIPKSVIGEINRQYIFLAFIMIVSYIIALILYFYSQYLWIIMLVVLVLVTSNFIYLP